jgi:predicted transcriptional regulator
MTITIAPQLEARVRDKARAEGVTVETYIEQLIREDEEWAEESEGPLHENDPEFAEIRAAVREGLEQADRGEGSPADEVFAELRAKHGIPR